MSQEKFMQNVQTALLSVCTTAAIGCFIFLWNINAFVSRQNEINDQSKDNFKTQSLKNNLFDETLQNHEKRISILEQKK